MSDIRDYTLAQVELFGEAAARAEYRALFDQSLNMRASQYDAKNFNQHLSALRKAANGQQ